ncbi:hypothetical protein [Streptomyces fungicidicus]|uniref:hypothetical protein n=1 Tax=Streptomyces fungicidicus TaxID=68203 RepID=UPI003820C749
MSVAQESDINVLETPLPQLLAAYRVELVDSSVTEADFFGAYVEHRDGSRVLSMPPGRPAFERDTAARMLLAQGLGLDTPPVPAALKVSVL